MTIYNVTGLSGDDDQAYAHVEQPKNREWQLDVFNDDTELFEAAADKLQRIVARRKGRRIGDAGSRKPVWPPEDGIDVMVEMWGTRPVVHVESLVVEGVRVALCGRSPKATGHKSHQLQHSGFVACKQCWNRQ